jgi:hypothetical protein
MVTKTIPLWSAALSLPKWRSGYLSHRRNHHLPIICGAESIALNPNTHLSPFGGGWGEVAFVGAVWIGNRSGLGEVLTQKIYPLKNGTPWFE